MTSPALALLAAAGMFALLDWLAVARERKPLEYVAKPAALLCLVGVAATLDPADPTRRGWFVAALALSLVGDVFLMLPRDAFVAGLASFLLAHLAYIVGFHFEGGSGVAVAGAALVLLVPIALLGRVILGAVRERSPSLLGPVTAYMAVIGFMVAKALADGDPVAASGALLFFASDALIAWNRFVRPFPRARLAIMVTYHLGQAGLVLSLL
ncbi:MAG TPA: lysoplasmalogenase, partial [Actinomycetota bacterium]|nr:lysoplasmalogenase [Actinomycetota bacterium]